MPRGADAGGLHGWPGQDGVGGWIGWSGGREEVIDKRWKVLCRCVVVVLLLSACRLRRGEVRSVMRFRGGWL